MPNDSPPLLTIPEQALDDAGFITSGKGHYQKVVMSYSEELFSKSIAYAEGDKADNLTREVTHDHVKKAYFSLANRGMQHKKPGWTLFCQVLEYVIVAAVGVCGSNMDKTIAQIGFGVGLFAVAMLVLARNTLGKEEK